MNCPICKTELVVVGRKFLETLEEHVSCVDATEKNAYGCPNKLCDANKDECIWDEDGAYYSSKISGKKYPFIDGNNGPFGSNARQCFVEIYKTDENFTLCEIFGFKVEVKFNYKADMDGKILKRTWRFVYWVRQKGGLSYTSYIPGIHMFWYIIKSIWRRKLYSVTNPTLFLEEIEPRSWDKRWWSLSSRWIMKKVVLRKAYRLALALKP